MFKIKVLQVISGNDNGGGANHLLNLAYYSKDKFHCIIGAIGRGALYDNGKKRGLDVIQFNGKFPYKDEILEYVKKNNIDIVNFHGAKAFFMHYFLKNKLTIPSVATIHSDYRKDFLNSKLKHMFFTPLSIKGLKSFNNYICVSNHIKSLVEKDNFQGQKFLINNGIDYNSVKIYESREKIRSQYNIESDDFVYVNVARMHPIKNHFNLIEAFNKLKKEIGNVKLFLVGEGELEEKVKEKISNLALNNDIIPTGFKKNSIDFVAASDVSILTSFSEGGSPPLVVLESAAVGKPFICSIVADIKETINEERGFLVNPYSVEDIYSKMKEAYEKKEQLITIGCNLHNFVKEQYSMDNFCNGYYKAYTKILQEK